MSDELTDIQRENLRLHAEIARLNAYNAKLLAATGLKELPAPKQRYLLFTPFEGSGGGAYDMLGEYPTLEAAMAAFDPETGDRAHILSLDPLRVILEYKTWDGYTCPFEPSSLEEEKLARAALRAIKFELRWGIPEEVGK